MPNLSNFILSELRKYRQSNLSTGPPFSVLGKENELKYGPKAIGAKPISKVPNISDLMLTELCRCRQSTLRKKPWGRGWKANKEKCVPNVVDGIGYGQIRKNKAQLGLYVSIYPVKRVINW